MAQLPILTLSDVRLSFGGNFLFEGVTFSLACGERAALVGRNGAGKSTLMRLITGRHEPDTGDVWTQPGVSTASVAQEPDMSGFPTALDFGVAGGAQPWDAESELDRFGVDPGANPATLSGGQSRRVALARAFAEMPDILLLDEPTNHLDMPMIDALEQRLLSFSGAVLLVSHDRRFLENVTTNTLWLRNGLVLKSPKGFATFESWASEIEAAEQKHLSKLQTHLKEETHWLARGVTGRRKRNMGRLQRLKDMRTEYSSRKSEASAADRTAALSVQERSAQSRRVLEAIKVSKAFGEIRIAEDLNVRVLRGYRIGLVGPNGVGKTTLLRLLLGSEEPDSGNIKRNKTLTVTYLDQTRETLKPSDTLWETLAPNGGDSITVQGASRHVVAYAKEFLFKPEQMHQPVSALSGGERNRLTLAIALAQPCDVLVLDEPTNDLDMQTLELLEDMLIHFNGTLILVSHDRAFLDATVTSCLVAAGEGRWVQTAGGWSDIAAQLGPNSPAGGTPGKTPKPPKKSSRAPSKPSSKLSFKDTHRLKEVEQQIPDLEAQISELEQALSDPDLYQKDPQGFQSTTNQLEQLKTDLEQAESDWLEIEARKEALSQS